MDAIITYIQSRVGERSTWLGIISLLASFGVAIEPDKAALLATIATAIAGAIMVITKDHKPVGQVVLDTVEEIAHDVVEAKVNLVANAAVAEAAKK
jgi:hypothetical protein